MLTIVFQLLQQLLSLYWWVVILAAVMSNLIAFGVVDSRNRLVWTIGDFLYRLTEPALRRNPRPDAEFRRHRPQPAGAAGADLGGAIAAGTGLQRILTGGIQPLFY